MRRILVLVMAIALMLVGAAGAGATVNDRSLLYDFEDGTEIGSGAGTVLHRSADAIRVEIHSRALIAGNAYTVWLVIFNNPDGCVDGCGEDDVVPGGPADVSVIWSGAGGVAGPAGALNTSGYLAEGNPAGYQELFADLGAPDPGFVDAEGAEIHTVVRDHGPATGNAGQLSTFEGDCSPESSFGLGAGAYDCVDVQFSIHLP
jgi:hypothetical protein